MFHPGESVNHEFTIPFKLREINQIIVSYKQNNRIVLEKTLAPGDGDVMFHDEDPYTRFAYELSQTETLLFEDNMDFEIQVNVYINDSDGSNVGTRHTSQIMKSSNGIQLYRRTMPKEGE